jgi:hypothetical protein
MEVVLVSPELDNDVGEDDGPVRGPWEVEPSNIPPICGGAVVTGENSILFPVVTVTGMFVEIQIQSDMFVIEKLV